MEVGAYGLYSGGKRQPTHVVSLEVEVREVEGDAILCGSDDLPDTVLVGRVEFGERRTLNCAVGGVDVPATGVCPTTRTNTEVAVTARLCSQQYLAIRSRSHHINSSRLI